MTYRQWTSVTGLVGIALLSTWLVADALNTPPSAWAVSTVAAKLLWAALIMVGFSIAAAILVSIVGSIVSGQEFKEERADERDALVYNKSMRNAYYVLSVGGLVTLLLLATGQDPALAAYAVFGAGLAAGATDAVSQLVYYRIG